MVLCVATYIRRFWPSEHHSHYKSGIPLLECFFDWNPFSTSSKIWQLWVVLYIVGKVWMRRLQRRWNRRKRFSNDGVILRTSLSNVDLRGGIDSRSLSRPLGGLNCDVLLTEMLP